MQKSRYKTISHVNSRFSLSKGSIAQTHTNRQLSKTNRGANPPSQCTRCSAKTLDKLAADYLKTEKMFL